MAPHCPSRTFSPYCRDPRCGTKCAAASFSDCGTGFFGCASGEFSPCESDTGADAAITILTGIRKHSLRNVRILPGCAVSLHAGDVRTSPFRLAEFAFVIHARPRLARVSRRSAAGDAFHYRGSTQRTLELAATHGTESSFLQFWCGVRTAARRNEARA